MMRLNRRRWQRGALCTGLAIAATVVIAQPADAWTPITSSGCDEILFPTTSIDAAGSHSDVKVIVHTAEFYASGADLLDFTQLEIAIDAVNDQFNATGATAARVDSLEFTEDPFDSDGVYGDTEPTIHVGFTPTIPVSRAVGRTDWGPITVGGGIGPDCTHRESYIEFLDVNPATWTEPDLQGWNFNTPNDTYYTAGRTDAAQAVYFRTSYLHELLHAFGIGHSDHSYSMMNYGTYPWANRPAGERIRPLPDDVEALRSLYPDSLTSPGSRTDTAIFNTWYDTSELSDSDAATQKLLCAPSMGSAWSPSVFAEDNPTCGIDGANSGSTSVCAGDTLRTRFAFANYSTESVTVTARAWFSLDAVWDPLSDRISPTQHTFTASAQGSLLRAYTWSVPSGLNSAPNVLRDYHVIIRVTGTTASGASAGVDDWNPLRGVVHAPSSVTGSCHLG